MIMYSLILFIAWYVRLSMEAIFYLFTHCLKRSFFWGGGLIVQLQQTPSNIYHQLIKKLFS